MTPLSDADVLRPRGPWQHQQISANGASFHVATVGDGPLILHLHGFPTFWWTWRQFLPHFAARGYQAAAMDLRGYGGSDHTPRGYDPFTTAHDVVGVIRSLGSAQATLVGHGWGGFLAWTVAALYPDAVSGIVPMSMAHPRRLRDAMISDRSQLRASGYVLGFQQPWAPERRLVARNARAIGQYLQEWSADTRWLSSDVEQRFRRAFMWTNTAHCALEYHRWALRSIPRADGRKFITDVSDNLITAPTLHLHGASDRTVLPRTAMGSQAYVAGDYRWELLPRVGHFPHEEATDQVLDLITAWLPEQG